MRAGWRVVPLGDVCTVVNGGTPKSNVATYWGGDVNWLTPKDMGQMTGRHIAETPRRITAKGLDNCSARLVPAGSVIMSTRAPIGHLAINDAPMAFNQGCRGMIPGNDLDPVFLFHFLSANTEALNELGTGTTFKELSATALRAFPIPLPPLDEQKRIVAVLDEAFEGLSRARANAEANLADARELYSNTLEQALLDCGAPHSDLGSHVDQLVGYAFKSAEFTDNPTDVRLLRGDNIVPGGLRWDGAKYWKAERVEGFEKYLLQPHDVLIAMDRTWIKAGIKFAVVSEQDTPSLLVQRVARLRAGPTILVDFLAALIRSRDFERYVLSIQTGTGVPHISGGQINAFPVRVPAIEVQAQIMERLNAVQTAAIEIAANIQSSAVELDTLRQSLLQKAFSGELT